MTLEEEDDAAFEAELAAERERLHTLNAAFEAQLADGSWMPPEAALTYVMAHERAHAEPAPPPEPFDPECPRCDHHLHICPGCGERLYHGLEVCEECRAVLAAEQVETEAAVRRHQDEVRRRQEARLAKVLADAEDLVEPEPPDITAAILEAQRNLRTGLVL